MEVRIECQGAEEVNLADLHDLQGNLKTLSEADYVKLRNSITEFGFSAPFFYWQDETGKKWITDGHSRDKVLRKMIAEGFSVPLLPACPIFAKNKTEAKKKLLVISSRYGKINGGGMTDFLNELNFEIDAADLEDFVELPEVFFEPGEQPILPNEPGEKLLQCPECKAKFTSNQAKLTN